MATDVDFDAIVAHLYRAAAGELPWGVPLQAMQAALPAWGVQLHGVRLADGAVAFSYDVGGFPPEGILAYITRYHTSDRRTAMVVHNPPLQWFNCHEHFDDAAVAADPFYQDFLIPYGGRWASGTNVYQDDDLVAIFGIHRDLALGPLPAAGVALGRRYAQHLNTALGLWRRQQKVLQAALIGNQVLQRLRQPALLVDEQLQLHHVNDAAAELLARDGRLARRGGTLAIARSGHGDALLRALRSLRLGGADSYVDAGPAQPRAVVRVNEPGRPPLVLLLTPLVPARTMQAFGPRPLALALLHDGARRAEPDPLVIAAAFDLTPAEARVAVRLARGERAQDVARAHGVTVATVRSQIQSVLEKVGARHQNELVSALAAMAPLG